MSLPSTGDVLVIGAGPAGSAAAITLARAGVRVVLADARSFPRDKVCGDGLISDSLAALTTLGLRDRVLSAATTAPSLCVQPPWGRHVELRGEFACVPREKFDAMLVEEARAAGAETIFDAQAAGPVIEEGVVAGASFVNGGAAPRTVRARITLLATGANATTLKAFGLVNDPQPGAVAGRAYYEARPQLVEEFRSLVIAYDREWCPGYGWIFPSPEGRFNIGVGLFTRGSGERKLRDFWTHFVTRHPLASRLVRGATQVVPFRGAPLRTALAGASFGRPGLLALGEAASMTYAATGEGIGKAMESGILAARLALEAFEGKRFIETLHQAYERQFRTAYEPRYHAYSVAQSWARSPIILSLLAARANAGTFARRELEDLIAERGDARRLFSKPGLVKALMR